MPAGSLTLTFFCISLSRRLSTVGEACAGCALCSHVSSVSVVTRCSPAALLIRSRLSCSSHSVAQFAANKQKQFLSTAQFVSCRASACCNIQLSLSSLSLFVSVSVCATSQNKKKHKVLRPHCALVQMKISSLSGKSPQKSGKSLKAQQN